MFRVKQSQTLPQKLNSLLSWFNPEATVKMTKPLQTALELNQMEISFAPIKRRRRARRFADHASTGLRSTWF